ncbi:virulence-associated protein VapB [Variovorax paradoxus]|nr:virulence-associated protein VapB [Variovorax paradoxus]
MSDLSPSARNVRLFRNGANQAVRIPREFELPGNEALMRREGHTLVIEPVYPVPKKGTLAGLAAVLSTMETLDDEFPDVDKGLLPLDDVDL